MAADNNNYSNSTTSTGDSRNIITLINLYFRGNYIFIIGIILSILSKQSDCLYRGLSIISQWLRIYY
jgi:hypothetical protein